MDKVTTTKSRQQNVPCMEKHSEKDKTETHKRKHNINKIVIKEGTMKLSFWFSIHPIAI